MHSNGKPDPVRLLAEARSAGGERLGCLLELYRNSLYLVARTRVDLHLQAQVNPSDLVQETFLEAYRDFGQFRGSTEAALMAWLRRILVHNLGRVVQKQVLAQKRTVRRQVSLQARVEAMERSAAKVAAALVSPCSSPSALAQRRERAALLADQLAQV